MQAELIQIIRKHLETKKVELREQIGNYPPPIPACDVQFNYLLEQRTAVYQELRQLDEVTDIATFVDTSMLLDDNLKQEIRAQLTK